MMKYFPIIFAVLLSFSGLMAQNNAHCGSDEYTEILLNNHPELVQKYAQAEQAINTTAAQAQNQKKGTQGVVYTIPVVVHVIYNTPYDNISKSQIMDGLRVLNEDYRRLNADKINTRPIFQGRAADVEVEFKLAKIAPDGSCTDGINRIQSPLSVNANDAVKNLIHWDNTKYLNIWIVNSIAGSTPNLITLGYAYRPYFGQTYDKDGVIIRHDRFGTIGTGVSRGRTLTHEVGHYLSLRHPFDRGCSPGDGIADTPPVASANFGACNFSANSCHNDTPDEPDMIENYMDYADDVCTNAFTQGQKAAMRAALQTTGLRKELVDASNLLATGVVSPPACAPNALFSIDSKVVCQGDTVQFFDETEDGEPDTYAWDFPGGTPSTSSVANPTVIYNQAGTYEVSLTVSNSAGTSTTMRQKAIAIRPNWTPYQASWQENFESPQLPPSENLSIFSEYDTVKFELTNLAASSGSQSLFLDNFNATEPRDVDAVVSPKLFTLFGQKLQLSFDYAYAKRTSSDGGILNVKISTDCGKTWTLSKVLAGGFLTTSAPTNVPYVPASGEWKTVNLNLSYYESHGPILVKFEFQASGGNNFYLDNINFSADNVGLNENNLSREVSIFPNPARDVINFSFEGGLERNTQLLINDVTGRSLYQQNLKKDLEQLSLNQLSLPAGVYFIVLSDGQSSFTKKLVIE